MTVSEQLTQARAKLSEAFALLDSVTDLDELERGALQPLKADVSYAIRKLSSLIVFAGIGTQR